MAVIIPPIKSQGIKTKLVPWINDIIKHSGIEKEANWIEPFFGTGVVGFNVPLRGRCIVGDTNPHIMRFYKAIQSGEITSYAVREYLERANVLLANADEEGYAYFREVKDRFNTWHAPLDFLFLSRAGFNGMMRFNRKGEWNIPFCKKPDRFAPAYVTKVCNQVEKVASVIRRGDWRFCNAPFEETIAKARKGDLIYCDPPYYGRYADYYNGWTESDEERLFEALSRTEAHFILSTWHHNEFRENEMMSRYWNVFNVETKEHFYHGGAHIENRHAMVEALVFNFDLCEEALQTEEHRQLELAFC